MKRYRSVGGTCFDVANTIFLVLLTIVMLYPLVNVLAISFSSKSAIDAGLVTWRPHGFNVSGYQYMLRDAELIHSYGWTIAYALGGVLLRECAGARGADPLPEWCVALCLPGCAGGRASAHQCGYYGADHRAPFPARGKDAAVCERDAHPRAADGSRRRQHRHWPGLRTFVHRLFPGGPG